MDKAISEIAKLTDRIAKDPKSKLFVPLAEEYKKAGDIDMAIHVLTEGLKVNSGYVTARSILGKLLFEQGNLEGSRKEFEEVVKAIPDNLMAQRKLGDIYVLQNKPGEALKHYKIVFSLNPRDEELASLVADLEAGSDVRTRLHAPVPPSSPEKDVKQKTQPAPTVKTKPPARVMPAAAVEEIPQAAVPGKKEEKVSEKASVSMTPAVPPDVTILEGAASSKASQTGQVESAEVPEEVLAVEPLDAVLPEPESPGSAFDFLTEKAHESTPAPELEAPGDTLFAVSDGASQQGAADDDFFAAPGIQESVDAQKAPTAAEPPFAADFVDADTMPGQATEDFPEVDLAEMPGTFIEKTAELAAAEAPGDQSDDFTTDTLAELYISQGFYEKAIDIYQRMLADQPNSRGLKDKLERVNAMAVEATAAQAGPVEEAAAQTEVPAESKVWSEWDAGEEVVPQKGNFEAREYVPPVETGEIEIEAEVVADLSDEKGDESIFFPEAQEYKPDAEGQPASGKEPAAFDVSAPPAQEYARAKPAFSDFEPREYVSPKTEAGPSGRAEDAPAAPMTSKTSKQATIDRLETWLKNIKKEI